MKSRSLAAAASLFLACGAALAAPLQLCVEDVPQPPWTTPSQGGLNFTLLAQVRELTDEQFDISPKPWRRCLDDLQAGRVDGVIGIAFSPERRAIARFPLLKNGRQDPAAALFIGHTYVFLRAGGTANWDGKSLRNPRGTVIAQRSYMTTDKLRRQGFTVLDDAKTPEDGLRRLAADSADVAVLHSEYAYYLAGSDPRFAGRVSIAAAPYDASPHFLAFSHQAYARDAKRIERIWQAIGKARRSESYRHTEAQAIQQMRQSGNP